MALLDDYDTGCTSILNKKPLPSLDAALKDLISEEIRRNTTAPRTIYMGPCCSPAACSNISTIYYNL